MSIFSKARVKTATKQSSRLDFSSTHITTSDFFQVGVPYIRHLVPDQSISLDMSCFSRLAPMPVPTLGVAKIKHHAFFVPYSCLMPAWSDFITDTIHTQLNSDRAGIVPFAHSLDLRDLSMIFLHDNLYCLSYDTAKPQLGDWDTTYIWHQPGTPQRNTTFYAYFTPAGRFVYKLLRQLGYTLETNLGFETENNPSFYCVSAFPLLALCRVYADWFYPSQYVGDQDYVNFMSLFNRDSTDGYVFQGQDIVNIFSFIVRACYDADYFTSAFDNPAGPNQGMFSSFRIDDISQKEFNSRISTIETGAGATPSTPSLVARASSNSSLTSPSSITQYALDSLHALSDYMKRHQLVGSRALERYLSRFGITPPTPTNSLLLGTREQSIDFGAIMSNASTDSASLGDYAGTGYSNGGSSFSFDGSKEYGVFIVVSTIIPQIGYVQGIDRNILHRSKLDFWTPEFDGLGTQAISSAELLSQSAVDYADWNANDVPNFRNTKEKVFGFTPRYAEYKIQHDKLTGDFALKSKNAVGMTSDSWHLFRLLDPSTQVSDLVHSKEFMLPTILTNGLNQFDRIFDNVSDNADHFVLRYAFKVTSQMPACPLFDTYEFDNESGKVIDVDAGGTQLN